MSRQRNTAISCRTLKGSARVSIPVFEERGFDRVNDPKVLKALALAISADMDHLRDNRCYSFSVRQDITAQGDKVYWYEYNILPYYKDTLTKAWYHQPEVEDGIIR